MRRDRCPRRSHRPQPRYRRLLGRASAPPHTGHTDHDHREHVCRDDPSDGHPRLAARPSHRNARQVCDGPGQQRKGDKRDGHTQRRGNQRVRADQPSRPAPQETDHLQQLRAPPDYPRVGHRPMPRGPLRAKDQTRDTSQGHDGLRGGVNDELQGLRTEGGIPRLVASSQRLLGHSDNSQFLLGTDQGVLVPVARSLPALNVCLTSARGTRDSERDQEASATRADDATTAVAQRVWDRFTDR